MMQSLLSFCRISVCLASLLAIGSTTASARTFQLEDQQAAKPIRFVLAGDSTVTDNAGWGRGFRELLNKHAECVNLAKGGRSSRSFRTEGWWQQCLDAKPDVLLIQFGHNDQPGKGPERESTADSDFRTHLRQYVAEARAAGIKPVLVTSLTRRRWNDQQRIEPTLSEYAEATSEVARELNVPLLDLHSSSIRQCEQLGPTAFRAFEPMTENGADHTHLNAEGSRIVGQLVVSELIAVLPELATAFSSERLAEYAVPQNHNSHIRNGSLQLSENESGITIRQRNRTILVYNKQSPPVPEGIAATYQRSGFLHPVASPAGNVVTATFPFDHAHQHGIFSAWVKTTWNDRAIDFWNLAGGTGRVLHQRVISTFTHADQLGFEVDLIHRTGESPVVDILRERWKITAFSTDDTLHGFDLETTQQALTSKPLIVNEYHYGGIALRGPVRWLTPSDRDQLQGRDPQADPSTVREPSGFLNDLGSDRVKGNHEHARWVSLSGQINGQPVSITVLCHASNFRAPQAARIHPTKPYFVFSPCVDGQFVIDREHPFHGRYRYLITDADPDPEWLNQQWQSWCSEVRDGQ